MGTAHKGISVVLRCTEFISACVVVGIFGYFLRRLDLAGISANGRIVYAVVTAALGIVISICLIPPLRYSFWAFPLDIVMFIMWIVAFALLENLISGDACSAVWYYNYWSFYWGNFWLRPGVPINAVACGEWRSVLGFSFISAILWLFSGLLGMYAAFKYRNESEEAYGNRMKTPWSKKEPEAQKNDPQSMTEA